MPLLAMVRCLVIFVNTNQKSILVDKAQEMKHFFSLLLLYSNNNSSMTGMKKVNEVPFVNEWQNKRSVQTRPDKDIKEKEIFCSFSIFERQESTKNS